MTNASPAIFLDSSAVIYWVEAAEPFYSRFINVMEDLRSQHTDARLCVSRLSTPECRIRPLRDQDSELLELYREFFSAGDFDIVELTAEVVDSATELRARLNLKTPDALQAAAALTCRGDTIMVTGDRGFRGIPGLKSIVIA